MEINYIDGVLSLVKNKKAKKSIELELQSHILDKIDYYVELGYDRKQAEQKANEEMGEPEEAAVPLNTLHSKKWYMNVANWVAIVILTINISILAGVFASGSTEFEYNYSQLVNSYCMQTDLVINDFICLGILFAVIALIYFARKSRSVFLAAAIGATLILEIIFPTLQPMFYSFSAFYAVVKLFTLGFGAYSDGIFGYGTASAAMEQPLFFVSLLTIVLLICYCAFVIVGIIRENLMKTGKNYKRPYKIIERTAVCIIAANVVFMSVFTAIAYINIDTKIEQNYQRRAEAIDYVVNYNVDKPTSDFKKEIQNMNYIEDVSPNYTSWGTDAKIDIFQASYNNLGIGIINSDTSKSILFSDMASGIDSALVNKDIEVSKSDFDIYKENANQQKNNSTTEMVFAADDTKAVSLSDFMQTDLAYKAVTVDKTKETDNGKSKCNIEFMYDITDSENCYSIRLVFTDEKLLEIHYWNGDFEYENK